MKLLLIFPPSSDPAHPPLGIASLAGYLRQRQIDVTLLDLNIRAYQELLSGPSLARTAEAMRERLATLEDKNSLEPADFSTYRAIARNILSADFLISRIDDALDRLRDHATYASRGTYRENSEILRRAMEFFSASYYPTSWTPGGLSMEYDCTRSGDVLAAIGDRSKNLFLPFFESVLSELEELKPDVVGISLNYHGQVIPSMTLAAMVKTRIPRAFVVVGGGLVPFFDRRWEVLAPFREIIDGWIPFEGERPLLSLVEALESGQAASQVAGMLTFDLAIPHYRQPEPPPSLAELPTPIFDGLPLDRYLVPEPILPYLTSRGCYWGRCAFCSHAHLYRGAFRSRKVPEVLDALADLSAKYGATNFYFVDEALPPGNIDSFAEHVAERALPYRWFGEARLEPCFSGKRLKRLHDGGCRMLIFGLESGVRRVLGLMEKGIIPQTASRVIVGCSRAGIRTFVMFFTGFPGETREEAEHTVRFVDDHRRHICHVATGQFVLDPQSPIFSDPERYSITEVSDYPDHDLKTWCRYAVASGLSQSEAAELAVEIERHIAARSDIYLISRSHLAFLPAANEELGDKTISKKEQQRPQRDLAGESVLFPVRKPLLVPQSLPFNLDEIEKRLADRNAEKSTVTGCPTQYVFDAERELLVEVGEDGIVLLSACSGRFSLTEICAAVGEKNRETALGFFRELDKRGFLEWREIPA